MATGFRRAIRETHHVSLLWNVAVMVVMEAPDVRSYEIEFMSTRCASYRLRVTYPVIGRRRATIGDRASIVLQRPVEFPPVTLLTVLNLSLNHRSDVYCCNLRARIQKVHIAHAETLATIAQSRCRTSWPMAAFSSVWLSYEMLRLLTVTSADMCFCAYALSYSWQSKIKLFLHSRVSINAPTQFRTSDELATAPAGAMPTALVITSQGTRTSHFCQSSAEQGIFNDRLLRQRQRRPSLKE